MTQEDIDKMTLEQCGVAAEFARVRIEEQQAIIRALYLRSIELKIGFKIGEFVGCTRGKKLGKIRDFMPNEHGGIDFVVELVRRGPGLEMSGKVVALKPMSDGQVFRVNDLKQFAKQNWPDVRILN